MMRGVSRFSVAAAIVLLSASSASADDDGVSKRLTKFGQLRRNESESLSENVSKRMKRAADMTSAQDPLRMAVGRALGLTNPNDALSAAKIRLRLYAGLNEWALDNLFAAKPGGIGRCQQEFGVTARQCEALVAAAGRMSAEEASKVAGGAPPPMPAAGPTQMASARPMAPPAGGSRFGKYDSGYRPQGAAQPQPMARPTAAVAQRPVAPLAAAPNPNAKMEYQRKRAEYLERKRQEMEARKQKIVATAGGNLPVDRGPATGEQAEPAAVAANEPAAQAKAPGAKGKAGAADAPAEEAPAEAAPPKADALDGDLLDSLLGDPLGKK